MMCIKEFLIDCFNKISNIFKEKDNGAFQLQILFDYKNGVVVVSSLDVELIEIIVTEDIKSYWTKFASNLGSGTKNVSILSHHRA